MAKLLTLNVREIDQWLSCDEADTSENSPPMLNAPGLVLIQPQRIGRLGESKIKGEGQVESCPADQGPA